MSSSPKLRRVFRESAPDDTEVFVIGESLREAFPTHSAIASADDVVAAVRTRAETESNVLRAQAVAVLAEAEAGREAAYQDGFEAGRRDAEEQFAAFVDLARRAAEEGKAVRDALAEQSMAVVARAAALATRRIVAAHYDASPEATASACVDAMRAASGQDVLALRVNPAVAGSVQVALGEAGSYVRPDDSVEIGGCIVDLRQGTIDASLDARLSLMDLALAEAGGQVTL
jgi:flagellar biosynthesis/type III secretory pathway protein FliH